MQERYGLRELHLVVQFGEANYVTAAAAAIAEEQVLAGIYHKAGPMLGMKWAQPH